MVPLAASDTLHPHACGENVCMWAEVKPSEAPPPRVWGKHAPVFGPTTVPRSTPTRVGKTYLQWWMVIIIAVHPHACGENEVSRYLLAFSHRSTPTRVGKTDESAGRCAYSRRSTPTRVGKTPPKSAASCNSSVHPHACGENGFDKPLADALGRSTPTRVGKTSNQKRRPGIMDGPPPRVWGKRCSFGEYAGRITVHPHACGENVVL